MKNIFVLLLLFGMLGLGACKKKKVIPPWLPDATQIGANTAGCLVDGEVFLAKRKDRRVNYLDGKDFSLWISKEVNKVNYAIGIHMADTPLEVGQTYQLVTGYRGTHIGLYHIGTNSPPNAGYYSTEPTVTGEITITHHSFDSAFLSGTFWFDAINSEGKIVEIRRGRFDMDY